jgi:hypothetical protein
MFLTCKSSNRAYEAMVLGHFSAHRVFCSDLEVIVSAGGPLLLMELGSVLRRSGAHVLWVTGNKKETTSDPMVVSLERKLLSHGLQVFLFNNLFFFLRLPDVPNLSVKLIL